MSANTPVIANWTQTGSAGDALVLSGQNLAPNSSITVSGKAPNGASFSLPATLESADGTGAVVILPQNLPSDTVFNLSVANAQGTSNSVTVNAPQVWWAGPNEATQGGVTSIFGQNLVLSSNDKPAVALKMTSGPNAGQTYTLSVVDANAYRVDVQIPTNLPPGAYTLLYNSGAGGAVDTSQAQAPILQVSAAAAPSSVATLNIANFGAVANSGADSASALDAAMSAAQTLLSSGTGVTTVKIQLAAGQYDIGSSIALPNNVDLEGAGAGATTISEMSNFNQLGPTGMGSGMLWTGQSPYGDAANVTIGNLTLDTNGSATTGIEAPNAHNLTVNSVDILAQNSTPIFASNATGFTLQNSSITGKFIELGSGKSNFHRRKLVLWHRSD